MLVTLYDGLTPIRRDVPVDVPDWDFTASTVGGLIEWRGRFFRVGYGGDSPAVETKFVLPEVVPDNAGMPA